MLPEPWGQGGYSRWFTHNSELTYAWHFDQLWALALTATPCNKKFLWPKLRAAQVCEDKDNHLQGSLIIWSSSKTITRGSTPGPLISPVLAFEQVHSTAWNPSCELDLISNQKVIVNSHTHHCTSEHILPLMSVLAHAESSASWYHGCLFSPSSLHSTFWKHIT